MEIFSIAAKIAAVTEYVDRGALESDLAKIHIRAAREGLRKVKMAYDKKAQVRSVVTQLEIAEQILEQKVMKMKILNGFIRPVTYIINQSDLINVHLIMTACYIYLGERLLAIDAIRKCREVTTLVDEEINIGGILGFTIPMYLLDIASNPSKVFTKYYCPYDVKEAIRPTLSRLEVITGTMRG